MCYFTLAHLLSVNHIIGTTINLLKKYSQFNKKRQYSKKGVLSEAVLWKPSYCGHI